MFNYQTDNDLFQDVGEWDITLISNIDGKEHQRTGVFVFEAITKSPIYAPYPASKRPGNVTGLLIRRKYVGRFTLYI